MKKVFIDSNMVIYANDSAFPEKQKKAVDLICSHMKNGTGVISTQVLQEYANTAIKKLGQQPDVVIRQIRNLETLEIVKINPAMINRAIEINVTYNISFWDACIVSAAEYADCDNIVSEDFNHGQFYAGMPAINPFE